MAKQKAEPPKVQQLERDLLLAKAKADKGKESSEVIQSLLQQGILMVNAAGNVVPFSQNVTIRRANQL